MTNSQWVTFHILWKAVSSHLFLWPIASKSHCEQQSHHITSYGQQGVSDIPHFVKGSLVPSFAMTNSQWVILHIMWKAVLSHLFLWPTAGEWAHFVKGSLIISLPMTNSLWVTLHILWKAVSLYLFYHQQGVGDIPNFVKGSHHIFSYDQQLVSDIAHLKQFYHIFSYDQQLVSDIAHFVKQFHHIFSYDQQPVSDIADSLITFFLMANSQWVTLHILWKAISSHHFYDQQPVSDIAHYVKGSLITSFPMTDSEWVTSHFVKGGLITSFSMTNSLWVTFHILWKAVLSHPFLWWTGSEQHCTHILCKAVSSHLFLWPTGSEWHFTICERLSHHIDQQEVSGIGHCMKGSLIASFPMNNSLWVILHILWKADSYDQQLVSDIWSSLITAFLMTNSEWVTFHISWKAVSSYLFIWLTGSKSHFTFCESGSLITSFPMTPSKWVTLHIVRKAVSWHIFLWLTVCEWYCTFCERQSHISSYNQQEVSEIAHFVKEISSHLFLWPTGSEYIAHFVKEVLSHCFLWPASEWHSHYVKGSLITSLPMTNREWVTFHMLWKAVSLHLFLWPTGSKWHSTLFERQSYHIFSCDAQLVSDIAHFVKGTYFPMINSKWVTLHMKDSLITSCPMTNSKWVTLHMLWKAFSSHLVLWPTASE